MADVDVEQQAAGRWSELVTSVDTVSPLEYQSFSSRLPAALTATGGVLAILGGLGAWVRATETTGATVEEVEVLMGHTSGLGWLIAGLGLVAMVSAFAWFGRQLLLKLVPIAASVAIGAVAVERLIALTGIYQRMISEASESLKRTAEADSVFNAGFGWGAWFLMLALVPLLLGTLVGVLRELDLWKGIAR
ncbi:MAG: hypothetical protein ACRDI1_06860 [Actinomycetota bacterium]